MSKTLSAELKVIEKAIKSAEHINLSLGYSDQLHFKTVALAQLDDAITVESETSCLPRNLSKFMSKAYELFSDNRSQQGVQLLYKILKANNINSAI